MRVRPQEMPLVRWLRLETEREATRDRAEDWGDQVRVRRRGCQPPRLLARGGGSGPREARAPLRAPVAAETLLALALGESGRRQAWPSFGGGSEGRDPARAGPDQPMRGKGRWVCRELSPGENGGGERERRNLGRWGGAEEEGAHPVEELIGEHEEAWPALAQ